MQYEATNPLVYFINGIGDRILNLPALRALAHFFAPRLKLLTSESRDYLIYNDIENLELVGIDTNQSKGLHRFDPSVVLKKVPTCDFFISLAPYFNPDIDQLLKAWQPQRSVGFFPEFQTHIPLSFEKHTCDLAFDIPRALNPHYQLNDFSAPPRFAQAAWEKAQQIRGFLPSTGRVLVLHCDTLKEKMWPAQRFRDLLDLLLAKHEDLYVFVVGVQPLGLDDIDHQTQVIPLYGLPLEIAMAIVAQADYFLGVDSCMLHVADIFQVPCVGLFGPTDPHEFGCKFGPHEHLKAETMAAIRVEEVMAALNRWIPVAIQTQ